MIIGSKAEIDSQTNQGKLSIKNPKTNAYQLMSSLPMINLVMSFIRLAQ
jgi:hypothetical protein